MVREQSDGHVVVVPVKSPASGKSRLRGLQDAQRRGLAEAFALDTVTACLAARQVGAVLVVTDDAAFARHVAGLGCATMPDGDAVGLNAVLRQGAITARDRWPHLRPVALCADLPALTPDDLDEALAHVTPDDTWFVADADGTGTTMYTAPTDAFDPRFGPGSREAHRLASAREIPGALTSLRRDVDDVDGLRRAVAIGVGRSSAIVVAGLDL